MSRLHRGWSPNPPSQGLMIKVFDNIPRHVIVRQGFSTGLLLRVFFSHWHHTTLLYAHIAGQETEKHPPVRPGPPSADALARARSRTVESLEETESHLTDNTSKEMDG